MSPSAITKVRGSFLSLLAAMLVRQDWNRACIGCLRFKSVSFHPSGLVLSSLCHSPLSA